MDQLINLTQFALWAKGHWKGPRFFMLDSTEKVGFKVNAFYGLLLRDRRVFPSLSAREDSVGCDG